MAGTITFRKVKLGPTHYVMELTCTADAAAATFPSTAIGRHNAKLVAMVTDPGAVAPTLNYDIAITDELSCDVLGGEGTNRSDTASEQVTPKVGSAYVPRIVKDVLTIAISGNLVNSAVVVIRLYFEKLA